MTTSTPATSAFRVSGWLVTLFAAIALTASCGLTESPVQRLQKAQQATLDAGSAAFTIEQSFEGGPPSGEQKLTTEGVLDFARRVGRATVKMADGQLEAVFVGDTTYLRLPPSLQALAPWIRIDRQDVEAFWGLKGISDDPSRNLDLLDGIVGDVERIGEENVRGVQTTHYRFTINLQQAVEKAPADRREAVRQQAAILGSGQLPTEVWLDSKGRIARQTFAIDLSKIQLPSGVPPPGGLSGTVNTRLEFYDFGTKVEAKPPPNDQVVDFGELQGAPQ
jgi:hypothetical protein